MITFVAGFAWCGYCAVMLWRGHFGCFEFCVSCLWLIVLRVVLSILVGGFVRF